MAVAVKQTTTYVQNGLASDINGVKTPTGQGLPVPSMCNYIAIPKTNSNTYVAANQYITSDKPLTLSATYQSTYQGQSVVVLDCARNIGVFFVSIPGEVTNFTFKGYDINYRYIEETRTLGSSAQSVTTLKTYLMVLSITPDNTINTVFASAGTSNRIGLPFFVGHKEDFYRVSWADAVYDPATYVTAGYAWRTTGLVSATTSDANGSILTPTAPNGARQLRVQYYCYGADSKVQNDLTNQVMGIFPNANQNGQINESTIKYVNVQRNASNTMYVYGGLTPYDLIGPQYPNDSEFLYTYRTVLAS